MTRRKQRRVRIAVNRERRALVFWPVPTVREEFERIAELYRRELARQVFLDREMTLPCGTTVTAKLAPDGTMVLAVRAVAYAENISVSLGFTSDESESVTGSRTTQDAVEPR